MDVHGPNLLTPEGLLKILQTETQARNFWIAYSGGLDSHVLLNLAHQIPNIQPGIKINALHVHHGLSQNADAWVVHCENICAQLQIPLTVLWVDAEAREGESPEEVAREARIAAWEKFLDERDCLLMAHHEADQAETILLRLFRGTGPLGLGGMPMKGQLGKGEFLRPLLSVSKETLLDYATDQNLEWIEDESNTNIRFDRNFVRHEILPRIVARWPRVVRSINRAGALCLETATAVQILAASDFQIVVSHSKDQLSVARLLTLEPVRRRGVLRYWLQSLGFALPSRDHMERIDREIVQAKPGSRPRLKVSNYVITREKGNLCVTEHFGGEPGVESLSQ